MATKQTDVMEDLGTSGFTTREDTALCTPTAVEPPRVHKKRVPRRREHSLTETAQQLAMTTPQGPGEAPLPKRMGARQMLPGSWVGRSVRISYTDCYGDGQEASAALLDWCSLGPVFNLAGERTVLAWDSLRALTLIND